MPSDLETMISVTVTVYFNKVKLTGPVYDEYAADSSFEAILDWVEATLGEKDLSVSQKRFHGSTTECYVKNKGGASAKVKLSHQPHNDIQFQVLNGTWEMIR